MNKNYNENFILLNKQIERNKRVKLFESYNEFFKISRHIFHNLKPSSYTVYMYQNKKELKNITILKFLYQLKSDHNKDIFFTGTNDNIPITNLKTITNTYYDKSLIYEVKKEDLPSYDQGLFDNLTKNNIKTLYFVNIYSNDEIDCDKCVVCDKEKYGVCKKRKPIGVISLSYADRLLTNFEKDELLKESKKISYPLNNIRNY